MNESEDETHVVSQAQLHALKNRLTVFKGLVQLMWRQIKRENAGSDEIKAKVGALLSEIAAMEDELARVERPRVEARDPDRLSLRVRETVADGETGSPT